MAVLVQSIESIEIHRQKRNKQKNDQTKTHLTNTVWYPIPPYSLICSHTLVDTNIDYWC